MEKLLKYYFLGLGSLDIFFGLFMLIAPQWALPAMGIEALAEENMFLRWLGVFVAAMGTLYFQPFIESDVRAKPYVFRATLRMTTVFRAGLAGFAWWGVLSGGLSSGWMIVAVTDTVLSGFQVTALVKHWGPKPLVS